MKPQAAILLTVFVGLLAVINCQDKANYYCGRRLSTALALVCENGLMKRSATSFKSMEDYGFPWIPEHQARSMGRSKRQVVSECCFKPCTISELQAYCADADYQ